MAIKTEFRGTPLVPKDIKFPEVGMLNGDFGKEVLAEYKGRAKNDYGNLSTLNVLNYSDNVVTGSNPFAVVLVNQIIRENGMRTATPSDIERALQAGVNLGGTYEDTALVLRSKDDPNSYLAKNVADQISLRQKLKSPAMIPLSELDLVKDASSPHGLAFKLRDDAQIIYAPILNKDGNFTSEDIDLETGLPKKVGTNGNRHLYVRDSGLSRLYLNRGLDLGSGNDSLANSNSDGRVCVVSGGVTSPKILNKYLADLQSGRDAQIAQVQERYAKAEKVLLGQ
ncbi:MAG: hypothetical protein WCI72_00945 [archaeon]